MWCDRKHNSKVTIIFYSILIKFNYTSDCFLLQLSTDSVWGLTDMKLYWDVNVCVLVSDSGTVGYRDSGTVGHRDTGTQLTFNSARSLIISVQPLVVSSIDIDNNIDHPGVRSYHQHQHPKSHSRQELFCFLLIVVTADVFKLKADASILINY